MRTFTHCVQSHAESLCLLSLLQQYNTCTGMNMVALVQSVALAVGSRCSKHAKFAAFFLLLLLLRVRRVQGGVLQSHVYGTPNKRTNLCQKDMHNYSCLCINPSEITSQYARDGRMMMILRSNAYCVPGGC